MSALRIAMNPTQEVSFLKWMEMHTHKYQHTYTFSLYLQSPQCRWAWYARMYLFIWIPISCYNHSHFSSWGSRIAYMHTYRVTHAQKLGVLCFLASKSRNTTVLYSTRMRVGKWKKERERERGKRGAFLYVWGCMRHLLLPLMWSIQQYVS